MADDLQNLIGKTKAQLASITDLTTKANKAYMEDNVHQYLVDLTAAIQSQAIDVKNYGAVGDGVADDTSAINAAITAAATVKATVVLIPPGVYKITSSINLNVTRLKLIGAGYSASTTAGAANAGRTDIVKTGNFTGIVITAENSILESIDIRGESGNGGDGISIEAGRVTLRDVSTRLHGGVGIRLGRTSNNQNLWRLFNVFALANTSHGIYVHDDGGAAPDCNLGIAVGLDFRSNGGDGLRLENTIDNQFFDIHSASNTGYGVNLLSGAKGNNFWFAYLEANTAGTGNLASGATQNFIWGCRQGTNDGWVIAATSDDNVVMGRDNSLNDMYAVAGNISYEQLHIADYGGSLSGLWRFQKNGSTRDLEIEHLVSNTAALRIKSNGGIANLVVEDGDITAKKATFSDDVDVNGGNITMDDNQFVGIDANNSFLRDGTAGDVTVRSSGDVALIMDSNNDESASKIKFMKDNTDPTSATEVGSIDETGKLQIDGEMEIDGDLNHDGSNAGFYGTAPVAQQTGVAVSAAAIHAALVNLGLITS